MKVIKDFYDRLYKDKIRPEYKKECESRSKDFFHKYILFFLNPNKNTRHEVVKQILPSGDRYIDIGCWTGESVLSYGAVHKFREVHGIDLVPEALKEAQKRGISTHFVDLNCDNIPFPDNYFECITLVAVIEHLVTPYHILEETRRVLKPEGVLIIGTPNVASLSNRIRILLGHRPRTSFDIGWDGGHLLYFTPKELEVLLSQCGFEIIGKYATGNLQFLKKLFFNLTGEFIFKCKLKCFPA